MEIEVEFRCACGGRVTDDDMCSACNTEYWAKWCEECGADPEEPCAEDCPSGKEK